MAQLNPVYASAFNIGGLNIYTNPMLHDYANEVLSYDGQLIRAVNVSSYPVGAKNKRGGYVPLLGTTQNQGSQVNSLFSWTRDNGTQTYLYCFAGSVLSYYDVTAGTATDWLPCMNGTFTGTRVGNAVLGNTMIIGDGVGSTRHSIDGTSFTNTTLAPASQFFVQYAGRIYASQSNLGTPGTSIIYSDSADATNWNISGTSDSANLYIPDAGGVTKLFTLANTLYIAKNSGKIFRWDTQNLYDLTTSNGPSSPYSYASVEGMGFWLNKLGVFTSQGDSGACISNPIQLQIYNDSNTGISGSSFGTAPGICHLYDYFVSVGSTQDSFTNEPLNNTIINYNYQKNEFLNWSFADAPTAFGTYLDANSQRQMVFGNSSGQVFQYSGTANTDNGAPIQSVIEMVFNLNQPHLDKDWRWFWAFFNPGCEALVQIAFSDTFTRLRKTYVDVGPATSGVVKYRLPTGARSKLLWLRITDNNTAAKFTFYGCTLGATFVDPG